MNNTYTILPTAESDRVEFKTTFNDEVIISLVAFSNTRGGAVYVGVSDNGEVKGIHLGKETIQNWINEIKNKTAPVIYPDAVILNIENKSVVSFRVSEYPVKPVSIKGRYYKRIGNANHSLSVSDVVDMHLQSVNSSWDFYPRPGKTVADISLEKVQKAINMITKRHPDSHIESYEEFLQKNELIKGDSVTNGCFLMFSKDRNIFTTIQMGHFASETVIKDDVSTSNDIISQIEEVMSFIIKHINKEIIISSHQIENIQRWQYPLDGIRELVLNMIIHRDYRSSADSLIKIFPHHIIFYNPGVPENITIEQLLSDDYISSPRNRQIAQMVKDIGLIEKYGTGIKRVCNLFADYNLPAPEFKIVQGGFFVKVWDTQPTSLKSDLKSDLKSYLKSDLKTTVTEQLILDIVSANSKIAIPQLAQQTGKGITATKIYINKLKEKGMLRRVGPAKGGHWEITGKSVQNYET